jgi:peptidoglycan/xylan/chitin deacetylase (PgdA/CDA1 family)
MEMNVRFGTKSVIKTLGGWCLRRAVSLWLRRRPPVKLIFMYHRVVRTLPLALHDPAMFVTAEAFEMHLLELSRCFGVVGLQDLMNSDSGPYCSVTFDDGWVDNYEVAFPILQKLKLPATVFLPVGMVGTDKCFWFESVWQLASRSIETERTSDFINHFSNLVPDWNPGLINTRAIRDLVTRLKALPSDALDRLVRESWEQLGLAPNFAKPMVMDWAQVNEMGRNGISFGSHGLSHAILTRLQLAQRKAEIQDSLSELKKRCGSYIPWFSYPNGDWDGTCIVMLRQAGYIGAVTTRPGSASSSDDFAYSRVGLHEHIAGSPSLLWFRIRQAGFSSSTRENQP